MDKRACVDASDRGQAARSDGKLLAARSAFVECADASCPSVVRSACSEWLADVERATPSIALSVRAAPDTCEPGHPSAEPKEVRIALDGKALTDAMGGRAVSIDPGKHALVVEAKGLVRHEESLVVREGEKSRLVTVVLDPAAHPCEAQSPAVPSSSAIAPRPPPESGSGARRTGAFVAVGVSVVGFALFGYFGGTGHSQYKDLLRTCAPNCSSNDVSPVNTKFIAADVALGVGIAGAALATLLFVMPRSAPARAARPLTNPLRVTF
jgi:hypothetical protein